MEARRYFLNASTRAFESGGSSAFFDEDVEKIELYFVRPSESLNTPYEYYDYSANSVKLAIGLTAPAALQTSWTAISTAATAAITSLVAGGTGANEVQQISFDPKPDKGSFALSFPARSITVSSASASTFSCAAPHGLYNGQSVALTGFAISSGFSNGDTVYVIDRTERTFRISSSAGGAATTFSLTSGGGTAELPAQSTEVMPYNVLPSEMQAAIARAGFVINSAAQITVTGTAAANYVLNYGGGSAGINFANVTLVGSTLARHPGLSANVSFNTNEVAALISGGNTNVTMEVEVAGSGLRQTYQQGATLSSDIIASSSPAPAPTITPSTSFNLIAPDTSVWNITIDNDGSLTATKQ
jgi:hypothetical protein